MICLALGGVADKGNAVAAWRWEAAGGESAQDSGLVAG